MPTNLYLMLSSVLRLQWKDTGDDRTFLETFCLQTGEFVTDHKRHLSSSTLIIQPTLSNAIKSGDSYDITDGLCAKIVSPVALSEHMKQSPPCLRHAFVAVTTDRPTYSVLGHVDLNEGTLERGER